VLAQVSQDLQSPAFVSALVKQARKAQQPKDDADEAAELKRRVKALETKIARLATCFRRPRLPNRCSGRSRLSNSSARVC
jgi:hypothetical protein